jgi:hypothetical protein
MIPTSGTISELRAKINATITELGASISPSTGTLASSISRIKELRDFLGFKVSDPIGTLADAVAQYDSLVGLKNWPPQTAPTWPPVETGATALSASNLKSLQSALAGYGFTREVPTTAENTAYFTNARCKQGHTVTGIMFQSPLGIRYPCATCDSTDHKDLWVQYPPYYCGAGSGAE